MKLYHLPPNLLSCQAMFKATAFAEIDCALWTCTCMTHVCDSCTCLMHATNMHHLSLTRTVTPVSCSACKAVGGSPPYCSQSTVPRSTLKCQAIYCVAKLAVLSWVQVKAISHRGHASPANKSPDSGVLRGLRWSFVITTTQCEQQKYRGYSKCQETH